MKLGLGKNAHWSDMSDYVVHFTKPSLADATGYTTMLRILSGGLLLPGPEPFGIGRKEPGLRDAHKSVCFSEVPLDQLSRIVDRRRCSYGIAFHKDFLIRNGGAPVWYVNWDSPQHESIRSLIERARSTTPKESDPVWRLTPLVDVTGKKPGAPYDYEFQWEREWRKPGPIGFTTWDVSALFIPEDQHKAAREFFDTAERDQTGPNYKCTFLDGKWGAAEIEAANPPWLNPQAAKEAI